MNGIAVSLNCRTDYIAVIILDFNGLKYRFCAALCSFVKRACGIINFQRNILYPVTLLLNVLCYWIRRMIRSRKNKPYFTLFKKVRGSFLIPCFKTGIPCEFKTHCVLVIYRGLLRVAYVKFNVVPVL